MWLVLNETHYLEGGNINPNFHIKLNLSVEHKIIIKKHANKENTRLANTNNNTNSRSLPAVTLQITPA
jgi:hypothetical protein